MDIQQILSNQSEPQPEQSVQQQTVKSDSTLVKPLLISLVVLFLLIGIYIAFAKYQSLWPFSVNKVSKNNQLNSNSNTQTSCSGEALKADEDIGTYKNYDDKDLGFSLKYPESWFVQTTPRSNVVNISYYDLNRNDNPNPPRSNKGSDKWEILTVKVNENSKNQTVQEFAQQFEESLSKSPQESIRSHKLVCINGQPAYYYKQRAIFLGAIDEDMVSRIVIHVGDHIYSFYSQFSDKHFETIVSTIHIGGIKQPSSDLATWQKYSNAQYGFELKYPDNWTYENLADADEGAGIDTSESDNSISRLDFRAPGGPNLNSGRVVVEIIPQASKFYNANLQEFIKSLNNYEGVMQIKNQNKVNISVADEAVSFDKSYNDSVYYTITLIRKSNYLYLVSIPRPTAKTKEYYDKILSTLRFMN